MMTRISKKLKTEEKSNKRVKTINQKFNSLVNKEKSTLQEAKDNNMRSSYKKLNDLLNLELFSRNFQK